MGAAPAIALVGYRGTGKSVVGRIVAERLGCPFADADAELEARLGCTIAELFAARGEAAFRDEEEATLEALAARASSGLVLATGGGVVLRPANRVRLQRFTTVVWLRASPSVIAARLRAEAGGLDRRPALTPAGTLAEIAPLLAAREPLYREVANLDLDTGNSTPEQAAEALLAALRGTVP